MRVVVSKLSSIYRIIGKQKYNQNDIYRKNVYCVFCNVNNGILVYNILTREILLLAEDEFLSLESGEDLGCQCFKYFVEHWFLVPSIFNERTLCDIIKTKYICNDIRQPNTGFESYTILTTTVCNARCHYCYEYGIRAYSMDKKTAFDVSNYIKQTHNGKIVLRWFGGEPLCNVRAIDEICDSLSGSNIDYYSTITSNGYLFHTISDDTIVNKWKLKTAQITLDGTHDIYNATKNYIDTNIDGFDLVLKNIKRILELSIGITIRLNMSNSNLNDMINLIDILSEKFSHYRYFKVYPYPIFEGVGNPPYNPTDADREALYDNCILVNEKIKECNVGIKEKIQYIKSYHCMADSGKSIVILPDGKTALCQHYNEDEICGSIYDRKIDISKQSEWMKFEDDIDECNSCFYLPLCCRLKKCPNEVQCSVGERKYRAYQIKSMMKTIYSNYIKGDD